MTPSAVTLTLGPRGPSLVAAPALPLERLVIGRPATEAAGLLPRLFNLCGAAQGLAARLSLGLARDGAPAAQALRREVIRDHAARLCVILPRALGMAAIPVPADPATLLGPEGLPAENLDGWKSPVAPLVRRIAVSFAVGVAVCPPLPAPPEPLAQGAFENSAAGRQSEHPLLRSIEARCGRGPLWRLAGILADLEAALTGRLPEPKVERGVAVVPASRGAYALRLTETGGVVTGIERRTPTDHMLAPGGALLRALASLPCPLHPLAGAVIALHDPCVPVTVREVADA